MPFRRILVLFKWVLALGLVGGLLAITYWVNGQMQSERAREGEEDRVQSPRRTKDGVVELGIEEAGRYGVEDGPARAVSWTERVAVYGQVVANPVSGRLQRFFGVSKLKIDPTLPGVENNLQARLTLEQQVTQDITFTYITNVTNSNPQIIRVEWAINRQWSAVALRDENGVLGLDFFFKKRF